MVVPRQPSPQGSGLRLCHTPVGASITPSRPGPEYTPPWPDGISYPGFVTSDAYRSWKNERDKRIAELLSAHATIGGTGKGRRWRTEQLNWALTLRVAAEFQGFARDLHTLAVECFVVNVAGSNQAVANALTAQLTKDRALDRKNAHPGSLGSDFDRLGLELWPTLGAGYRRASKWNNDVTALNKARNAIAHANEHELGDLAVSGYPMRLSTVRRWRSSLDGLAHAMDDVVGDYLDRLLGCGKPW